MLDSDELWPGFEIRVIPGPQPNLYGVAFRPKETPINREGHRAGKPPTVFLKVERNGSIEIIAYLAMEAFPGLRQADFERRAVEEMRRTIDAMPPAV